VRGKIPDLDPGHFRRAPRGKASPSLTGGLLAGCALEAGVDLSGSGRAGTYLQVDRSVLQREVLRGFGDHVEILPLGEALGRHRWLREHLWSLVPAAADRYTKAVAGSEQEGYFIRILPGRKVGLPIQSCLVMARSRTLQGVHNVVVAEEGSEAHLITGCLLHAGASSGLHLGVSEFFVRRGASLTFTMIHSWDETFHVRPRSAALVEDGGAFVSNYVLMSPVGSLQMYPATILRGKGSRARFQALLYGRGASLVDIGSRTVLEGAGCSSETVSRAIGADRSVIVARGTLTARTDRCRGHLECRGILASGKAVIRAVPELEAEGVPGAELSHEAAISPIAEEEVAYLMTRGLGREEALATIVRGFLNVDLLGLPPELQRRIDEHLAATPGEEAGM